MFSLLRTIQCIFIIIQLRHFSPSCFLSVTIYYIHLISSSPYLFRSACNSGRKMLLLLLNKIVKQYYLVLDQCGEKKAVAVYWESFAIWRIQPNEWQVLWRSCLCKSVTISSAKTTILIRPKKNDIFLFVKIDVREILTVSYEKVSDTTVFQNPELHIQVER